MRLIGRFGFEGLKHGWRKINIRKRFVSTHIEIKSINNNQSEQKLRLLHTPVLADTVMDFLNPAECNFIVDMTFGAGGHTKKILEKSKHVKIFCLDRDPLAYGYAEELKREYPDQIIPLLGKFSELPSFIKPYGLKQNSIDAMLFDFGCSSMQFDEGSRGFSISRNGPLDMRMNPNENCPTAAQILAHANEGEITKILKLYGEEKLARKIARTIIETRYTYRPVETTKELADIVADVCGTDVRTDKLGRYAHVATKTFQGLRIFVNNELNEINYAMVLAEKYLKIGGVMVTLTFHSLEDTIVKRHVTGHVVDNAAQQLPLKFFSHLLTHDNKSITALTAANWSPINKHVIEPTDYEISCNPRSRSAKLRACIRVK